MIAYIKGEVAWIEEERIVLESGNIGYNIMRMILILVF